MSDAAMTTPTRPTTPALAQTWVAVTDGDGRTRLEAHWVAPAAAHASHAA